MNNKHKTCPNMICKPKFSNVVCLNSQDTSRKKIIIKKIALFTRNKTRKVSVKMGLLGNFLGTFFPHTHIFFNICVALN